MVYILYSIWFDDYTENKNKDVEGIFENMNKLLNCYKKIKTDNIIYVAEKYIINTQSPIQVFPQKKLNKLLKNQEEI